MRSRCPGVRIIAIDEKYFENHQNQNWELEAENLHKVPQDECEKKSRLDFSSFCSVFDIFGLFDFHQISLMTLKGIPFRAIREIS